MSTSLRLKACFNGSSQTQHVPSWPGSEPQGVGAGGFPVLPPLTADRFPTSLGLPLTPQGSPPGCPPAPNRSSPPCPLSTSYSMHPLDGPQAPPNSAVPVPPSRLPLPTPLTRAQRPLCSLTGLSFSVSPPPEHRLREAGIFAECMNEPTKEGIYLFCPPLLNP